jgi:hypothetical protein
MSFDVAGPVNRGEMIALATAVAQIHYVLHFTATKPDPEAARGRVELTFTVTDDQVHVRDGYDMVHRWDPATPPDQIVTVPSGDYRVSVLWVPRKRHDEMHLHLHFEAVEHLSPIQHEALPFIEYDETV